MKLTKSKLKQIIKEEMLKEWDPKLNIYNELETDVPRAEALAAKINEVHGIKATLERTGEKGNETLKLFINEEPYRGYDSSVATFDSFRKIEAWIEEKLPELATYGAEVMASRAERSRFAGSTDTPGAEVGRELGARVPGIAERKLTKTKLKQIIKEEIENVLKEESFQQALNVPGIGSDTRIENFMDDWRKATVAGRAELLKSDGITCELLGVLRRELTEPGDAMGSTWAWGTFAALENFTEKVKDLKCDSRLNFNPNYMAKAQKHAARKAVEKRRAKEGERERRNRERYFFEEQKRKQ